MKEEKVKSETENRMSGQGKNKGKGEVRELTENVKGMCNIQKDERRKKSNQKQREQGEWIGVKN